jgi:hypothetical protein
MSMLELRPAVAADVEQMAALHVAASRHVYAGLMPQVISVPGVLESMSALA